MYMITIRCGKVLRWSISWQPHADSNDKGLGSRRCRRTPPAIPIDEGWFRCVPRSSVSYDKTARFRFDAGQFFYEYSAAKSVGPRCGGTRYSTQAGVATSGLMWMPSGCARTRLSVAVVVGQGFP